MANYPRPSVGMMLALSEPSRMQREESGMSRNVKYRGSSLKSPPRAAARRRPHQVSRTVEYRGLCSTCKNAPACTFLRDPRKTVVCCEEFDGDLPRARKPTAKERSPLSQSYAARDEDSARFSGLCSNCENRKSCVFPKPEGGVWHCEEYL